MSEEGAETPFRRWLSHMFGPVAERAGERAERRRRKRFADLLAARLSGSEAMQPIEYDPEAFTLNLGNGQVVNLAYFWHVYSGLDAEKRKKHIESIAQGLFQGQFELPEEYEDARVDLLPKVWARAALDRLDLEAEAKGLRPPEPSVTPLGSHLLLGVVYDLPNSMKQVHGKDFGTWEVTFFEAMEQAVENLRQLPMQVGKFVAPDEAEAGNDSDDDEESDIGFGDPGDTAFDFRPEEGGLYAAMIGDSYDATRLLLIPDLVESEQLPLRGRPVVMMPCRDVLLVTGDDDEDGLVAMADMAGKIIESEVRLLVPTLLRHENGEWADFHVPPAHPAAIELHQLELRYLVETYEMQKELLEGVESRRDDPADVGELLVFRHRELGRWMSLTVWTEGTILLPKADFVAIVTEEGADPVYATWDDIVTLTGELLEPVDLSPPRWRVGELPHPKAVEILAETSENPMPDEAEG